MKDDLSERRLEENAIRDELERRGDNDPSLRAYRHVNAVFGNGGTSDERRACFYRTIRRLEWVYWTAKDLQMLASNLYVAACLCESFELGYVRGYKEGDRNYSEAALVWRPGCGWAYPP